QARQQAYDIMIEHAIARGANAIVGVRYDASDMGGTSAATEVLCYGTAVVVRPRT
ncbi:MAG: YbjQ family protein, partial [Phycisphaerae bacterium]